MSPKIQITADLARVALASLRRPGARWFAFARLERARRIDSVLLPSTEIAKLGSHLR